MQRVAARNSYIPMVRIDAFDRRRLEERAARDGYSLADSVRTWLGIPPVRPAAKVTKRKERRP